MIDKTAFFKELLRALGTSLLCLLVFETLWPGAVNSLINLNYLLIIWLITAILTVFLDYSKH
jgi:hypothetical protein